MAVTEAPRRLWLEVGDEAIAVAGEGMGLVADWVSSELAIDADQIDHSMVRAEMERAGLVRNFGDEGWFVHPILAHALAVASEPLLIGAAFRFEMDRFEITRVVASRSDAAVFRRIDGERRQFLMAIEPEEFAPAVLLGAAMPTAEATVAIDCMVPRPPSIDEVAARELHEAAPVVADELVDLAESLVGRCRSANVVELAAAQPGGRRASTAMWVISEEGAALDFSLVPEGLHIRSMTADAIQERLRLALGSLEAPGSARATA